MNAFSRDSGGGRQIDPDRRRHLSYGEIDRHNHPEMDGIDPDLMHQWEKYRKEYVKYGNRIEEKTGYQNDAVRSKEQNNFIRCQRGESRSNSPCQSLGIEYPGENAGGNNNGHDRRGGYPRFSRRPYDIRKFHLPIDKHIDKNAVNNRHRCSFGGCKNSAVYASQNDNRRHKSPESSPESDTDPHFLGRLAADAIPLLFRNDIGYGTKCYGDSDPGQNPRNEQFRY